jgi:hypothetical protein
MYSKNMPRRARTIRGRGAIGDLLGGVLPGPLGMIAKTLGGVLGLGHRRRRSVAGRRRRANGQFY